MSTLYIVATPIGNLEDISLRALRVLKEVNYILCEDTRVTRVLLDHYSIRAPTISYHQHSKLRKLDFIVGLLREGKNLALVSDAGTPGVSDPGNELIRFLLDKTDKTDKTDSSTSSGQDRTDRVHIVPIPGPSAVMAIASIAGFPMDHFLFLGFPPRKKKRTSFFEGIVKSNVPVIFFESPHRITRTLKDMKVIAGNARIVVGRELTKKFETTYRGTIEEVIAQIEKDAPRGEYTIVMQPYGK